MSNKKCPSPCSANANNIGHYEGPHGPVPYCKACGRTGKATEAK